MNPPSTAARLQAYYRWHAGIYDWTRWGFLFGRQELVRMVAECSQPRRVLEVGCGTGANLVRLAETFPSAEITGLDCSGDMLARARRKVDRFGSRITLRERCYDRPVSGGRPFDVIVASYCLSMINPGHASVLRHCRADLDPQGLLAIVDFHDTSAEWFRRWMALNHVRMEGQILADLSTCGLQAESVTVRSAYGGLWRWAIAMSRPV